MSNKLVRLIDGNDSVYAEGAPFSSDEVVVGTWINGKPLYRKVYSATTYSSIQVGIVYLDTSFVDKTFQFGYGNMQNQHGSTVSLPFAEGDSTIKFEQASGNTLYCYLTNCGYYGTYTAVIYYTKTTD